MDGGFAWARTAARSTCQRQYRISIAEVLWRFFLKTFLFSYLPYASLLLFPPRYYHPKTLENYFYRRFLAHQFNDEQVPCTSRNLCIEWGWKNNQHQWQTSCDHDFLYHTYGLECYVREYHEEQTLRVEFYLLFLLGFCQFHPSFPVNA